MDNYTQNLIEHIRFCNDLTTKIAVEEVVLPDLYMKCNVYNQAEGSSIVHLNNTIVTCGFKVKVHINQNINQSTTLNKGILVTNVELTPLCNKNIQPGLPGEESQYLTDQMKFILHNNGPDLDKLVIKENKAVYVLYFDFIVLNHDGNLLDACVLAANILLKSAKIPTVIWHAELDNVELLKEQYIDIPLNTLMYSITYALREDKVLLNINETLERYLKEDIDCVTFFVSENENCMLPIISGYLSSNKQKLLRSLIPMAVDRMKTLKNSVLNACK